MKRLFILLFASILAMQGFSQAYDFKCEREDDAWTCELNEHGLFSENKFIQFSITGRTGKTCVFTMMGWDDQSSSAFFLNIKEVKLFLQNGEILTVPDVNGVALAKGLAEGIQVFGLHKIKSLKNPSIDQRDNGNYAMTQLRKYNIIKILFDDKEFTTPGLRSAATINEMCKTLIGKTGDQGQYGSAPSGGPEPTPSPSYERPSTLAVTAPLSITTHDLLNKVLGVRECKTSIWEVDWDYICKEQRRAPRWNGDNPPYPISYLGHEINSINYYTEGFKTSPDGIWYDSREIKTYSFWFSFEKKDKKAHHKFIADVLADFKKEGLDLRKLDTRKSNVKDQWGVVVDDKYVNFRSSPSGISRTCTIDIYRANGEEHKSAQERNAFLR